MIPATFTLIVALASTSANALPILSGFFASPAPRAQPATIQRRDLTGAQNAQGTNAFFGTLLLEDACTPGQVSCINNNTATCSGEGNWEITPCTGNSTCLAIPASSDPSNTDLVVKCTTQAAALSAIEQAGGDQQVAADFSIDTAPFNSTVVDTPSESNSTDVPTPTDSSTDAPTGTDSSAPDATCTGDDGSDDGSDDGFDDGSEDPTDSEGTPEFTQSLGGDIPEPTGTDASTDPTATCSEDPSEPTETEFITVIAFPDPTDSNSFSFSTVVPTDEATETLSYDDPTPTEDVSTSTATDAPIDVPTDASTTDTALPTDPNGSDANVPTPTDSTSVPCVHPEPQATSSDNTNTATATDAPSTEPTTLTVPANFSIETPVPDINTVGTFAIPAPSVTPAPGRKRSMQKKVRRS